MKQFLSVFLGKTNFPTLFGQIPELPKEFNKISKSLLCIKNKKKTKKDSFSILI